MPRKPKTAKKAASDNHEAADNLSSPAKGEVTSPVKAGKKSSKTTARKSPASRKSRTGKTPTASHGAEPSAEEIQLRAYFISEHRHRHGGHGDHHSDWLEARRQLIREAQQK